MGLFDPPYKNILAKIPVSARSDADRIESYIEVYMTPHGGLELDQAKAFVLSIWACNSAMAGLFPLVDRDWRMVQNWGLISARMMQPSALQLAERLVPLLQDDGVIPPAGTRPNSTQ